MTKRMTMTLTEAAATLGIAKATAYKAAKTGQLPTIRMGHRLLVPRRQLAQMLDGTASIRRGEGSANRGDVDGT